jgi:hypothetical protein
MPSLTLPGTTAARALRLLLPFIGGSFSYSYGALPPILLFENGTAVTPATWPARRAEIFTSLQARDWGTFPLTRPPISSFQALNSTTQRGVEVAWHRVTVSTPGGPCDTDVEVLRPPACTASAPCPAFMTSKEHRRWALVAVSRAYVGVNFNGGDNGCDTPECAGVDSTRCLQTAYPSASFQLLARRAFLASLVLDFVLTALPFVHPAQVGLTGHSRNGKAALFAAALDARFAAVVDSSSGANGAYTYRLGGGEAQSERPASTWPGPWFLPSLRAFDGREHELPFDAHTVLGLIAPRPLLLAMATHDAVGSFITVEATAREGAAVYDFLNAPEGALSVQYRAGDHHGFEAVATYVDFFDAAFGRPRSSAGAPPRTAARFLAPPGAVAGPLAAFNWSAWNAVNAPRAPPPPAAAGPEACVAWALGEAPAGPVVDPGGSYPPKADLDYADLLQRRDVDLAQLKGGVVRTSVAFGGNVISGSLFYRPDMMVRQPPSPAGWPAVVYLHGANYNKAYVASYATDSIGIPAALANASHVVLAYEQLGFGLRFEEGANFYARFPRWSKLGALVADAASAVDVLSAKQGGFQPAGEPDRLSPFPRVDPSAIFLVGYGLGGAAALHAAALDARVAGVAAVSGWSPLRGDADAPGTPSGGMRRWWELHATQPRLGWFSGAAPAPPMGRQEQLPYDYELCVLPAVAPRPVLTYQPLGDRANNASGVAAACARLAAGGYAALQCQTPPGVNVLDAGAREALLAWLDAQRRSA